MARYILNSAVITNPGVYKYYLIDSLDMVKWLDDGNFKSTIGYPETCEAMFQISGCLVECNRELIKMQAHDEALVFRLTKRLSEPELKGNLGAIIILDNCEIGVLKRLE